MFLFQPWAVVSQLSKVFHFTLGQRVSLLICSIDGFWAKMLYDVFLDPNSFKYTAKTYVPCLLMFCSLFANVKGCASPRCCKNGSIPAAAAPLCKYIIRLGRDKRSYLARALEAVCYFRPVADRRCNNKCGAK